MQLNQIVTTRFPTAPGLNKRPTSIKKYRPLKPLHYRQTPKPNQNGNGKPGNGDDPNVLDKNNRNKKKRNWKNMTITKGSQKKEGGTM